MLEYNAVKALTKPTMLRYFWEDLKHFILAKLEHQDLELENFDQMIKTIDNKAKNTLLSCSSTRKMVQNSPHDNWSANSTVAKS